MNRTEITTNLQIGNVKIDIGCERHWRRFEKDGKATNLLWKWRFITVRIPRGPRYKWAPTYITAILDSLDRNILNRPFLNSCEFNNWELWRPASMESTVKRLRCYIFPCQRIIVGIEMNVEFIFRFTSYMVEL